MIKPKVTVSSRTRLQQVSLYWQPALSFFFFAFKFSLKQESDVFLVLQLQKRPLDGPMSCFGPLRDNRVKTLANTHQCPAESHTYTHTHKSTNKN